MATVRERRSGRGASRTKRGGVALQRRRSLRESHEQFGLAQEALGIVTWIWDIGVDRVQWQGDASRLLGLPPHGFSGRFSDYLKQVHPGDAESAKRTFVDCLKGRRPQYRAVERVLWPDGSVHWLETYGRAVYGRDGRAVRMTGVIKEITERKKQESARLKAEKQLARVFDASPDYIVVTRADDGRFVAVNPAFERATGYHAQDVVGRTAAEVNIWAIPGERERWIADLRKQGSLRDRPVLLRAQNGRILSALLSTSLVEHEGERLLVSIAHDISEAKRLERRARRSERKYAALFDTSPIGLVVTRPEERRIVEINDAALRLLGLERDQAIGALNTEVVRPDDPAEADRLRALALAGEPIIGKPFGFTRRDGKRVEAILSAGLVELDGEAHLVISLLDVTETRLLEQRAHQSERMFAALFENSPEPITLYRLSDQRRLTANSAWERATGYSREKAAGQPASTMGLFRDPLERARLIARIEAEGAVSNVEARLVRADGSELDALISAVCIEHEGERCVLWTWRDVTAERRAQRARQEADARYRSLFETALDGFVIVSPQWTFVDLNPAACRYMGYAREELVGKPVSAVLGPAELAANPIRPERQWTLVERTLTCKDGTLRAIEVQSGPMPDGNILVVARDISERKRNERLLMNVAKGVSAELGEAFFRSLVEHLARALGADFAFVGELAGADASRMRTLALLADGEIAAESPEYPVEGSMSAEALALGHTVAFEQGVAQRFADNPEMRRHGVQAYVGTPLFGADGKAIGVLAVAHRKPIERGQFWASMIEIFGARAGAEIERARAEATVRRINASLEQIVQERTAELEEANRELESYNYSISHDLRQPLNAIAGFAELLRDRAGAPELECIGEIEGNAVRMEQMIDALLRLSRAGRGAISKVEVDVRGLVDSVLHDLSASAPLGAEIALGELPAAMGDPVLLRQVWANLIGNALKYSSHSPAPRVQLSGARRDGLVEYSIRDNGIGFDEQHAGRIFDPFQRLPSAKQFEGSGVGLAIVERIVRRHGGSIRAHSSPGQGALFRFTLPDGIPE